MKYYISEDNKIKLYNEDCFKIMRELIKVGAKFDAIVTDIPQEITQNEWDKGLDLDRMWKHLLKLRKDETTPIILFSNQPYTSKLIMSNLKMFKYCKYWQKDRPSGFLNAKRQPLRDIEDIVVFYEKQCYYNPIMWEGKPSHSIGKVKGESVCKNNNNYGNFARVEREGTQKYPRQLMTYNRPHPPIHPTEKPVDLLIDLLKTYTKENDLILDFTAGSFSMGIACIKANRQFIGIELDEKYFEIGKNRIVQKIIEGEN